MDDRVEKWGRHFDRWQACRLCKLHEHRSTAVTGRGSLSPLVAFIGIGPGEVEDEKGLPFVGPAGRVLSKAIAEAGGDEERCLFLNLVACRPTDDGRSNRDPDDDEVERCRVRLLEATRIARAPKVLVLLGRLVERHDFPAWPEVPRVKLWHPAFVVRSRKTYFPSYVASMREVFSLCERM